MGQVMEVQLSICLVLLSVDSKPGNKTAALPWPDQYETCHQISLILIHVLTLSYECRDHFVNASSQWVTALHCNILAHWLGAFIKWSLWMMFIIQKINIHTTYYLGGIYHNKTSSWVAPVGNLMEMLTWQQIHHLQNMCPQVLWKVNKSDVTRWNTLGCLYQYTCRGLRLWNSQDHETV